jgi:hypothetical protein
MRYLKSVAFSVTLFFATWALFYIGGLLGNEAATTLIIALLAGLLGGLVGIVND